MRAAVLCVPIDLHVIHIANFTSSGLPSYGSRTLSLGCARLDSLPYWAELIEGSQVAAITCFSGDEAKHPGLAV